MPLSGYADVDAFSEGVQPVLRLGDPLSPSGYTLPCRRDPSVSEHLSAKDLANILVVLVADVAEQLCDVLSYTSVYQVENPRVTWPGNGSPGLGLAAFSLMLRSAAPFLDKIPPVSNSCTETLSQESEETACTGAPCRANAI